MNILKGRTGRSILMGTPEEAEAHRWWKQEIEYHTNGKKYILGNEEVHLSGLGYSMLHQADVPDLKTIRPGQSFQLHFKDSYFNYDQLFKNQEKIQEIVMNFGGRSILHEERMVGPWKPEKDTFVRFAYKHKPDNWFWCLIKRDGTIIPHTEYEYERYLEKLAKVEAQRLKLKQEVKGTLVSQALKWMTQ